MNLFCPFYDESQWKISPQNAANNVNDIGRVDRTNVYTLERHGGLLAVHEAMTRKIVAALREFDNVYYEICNEPYFGGVTLDWQRHIAQVIVEEEKTPGPRHLISQNIANDKARVRGVDPAVSIYNFHYATPPETVAMNYDLGRVIGDNETGFRGTNDLPYRREGWEFILAGGALYNNLDYSFTAGHERGDFVFPAKQPGGGGPVFRRQMTVLVEFMKRLDFVRMKPAPAAVTKLPAKAHAQALVEPGRQYAVYAAGWGGAARAELTLQVDPGQYQLEWVDPLTGAMSPRRLIDHAGGGLVLPLPQGADEVALRLFK